MDDLLRGLLHAIGYNEKKQETFRPFRKGSSIIYVKGL